jgi:DNA-binding transcriptional ArsR family regulator
VWNGILEHRKKIAAALWEFVWCLDRITSEKDGVGTVLGGKPVTAEDIAKELGGSERTTRSHLAKLEAQKYIKRKLAPYGHVISVLNSNKFGIWSPSKRSENSCREVGKYLPRGRKETSDLIKTQQDAAIKTAAAASISPKPEDSVWSFLGIEPCGPISFRTLLESRWASRNGDRPPAVIGETVDAWEEAVGGKLRRAPQLFRALADLRQREHAEAREGQPIHVLTAEEIPV